MTLVRGSVAVDEDGVVTGTGYALELFNLKMADIEIPTYAVPDVPTEAPPLPPAQNLNTAYDLNHWLDQFPTLSTPPPEPTAPVSEAQAQAYIDAWTAAFIAAGQALHDNTIALNTRVDMGVKVAFAKAANAEAFVIDYLKANAVIPAGIPVETTGDESAQSGSTTGPGSLT